MGNGLEIETKESNVNGNNGKFWASEFNKIVDSIKYLIDLTDVVNGDTNSLTRAIEKLSKNKMYIETTPGDGINYIANNNIANDESDVVLDFMTFIFVPSSDSVSGNNHTLSINGGAVLPLINLCGGTGTIDDMTLKAGLAYLIHLRDGVYYIMQGIHADIDGSDSVNFEVGDPLSLNHVVNLKTLDEKLNGLISNWKQLAKGPEVIRHHTGIYYKNSNDENIMITYGGEVPNEDGTNMPINRTWEYNIDTEAWNPLADGPLPRLSHTAIYYKNSNGDDLMVIYGGRQEYYTNFLNDLWEYNITTNAWRQLADGPKEIYGHAAIHYNDGSNDIMLISGGADTSGALTDLWQYNLTTDVWTQLANIPVNIESHSAVLYSDTNALLMVIHGGYQNTSSFSTWGYDIVTDEWFQLANGPTNRVKHTAVVYTNDDSEMHMLAYGGSNTSTEGVLNDTWTYSLDYDAWEKLEKSKVSLSGHVAIVYTSDNDPVMLVHGGNDFYNNLRSDIWEYKIPTLETDSEEYD